MQCETFESRMHSLLDNRQRPEVDPQLQAHALGCQTCQQRLEAQELLFNGLDLFQPPTPTDLTATVVKNVVSSDRRRYGAWALLAAAVLILAGIAPFAIQRLAPAPNANEFVQQPQPVSLDSGAPDEVKTEDYLGTLASALPVTRFPDSLDSISLENIDSVGLAKGLRPLASSFTSVYGLLRRTIPVGRDSREGSPQAGFAPFAHLNA